MEITLSTWDSLLKLKGAWTRYWSNSIFMFFIMYNALKCIFNDTNDEMIIFNDKKNESHT